MPGKGDTYMSGRSSTALPIVSAFPAPLPAGEYELKAGMTLRQLIARPTASARTHFRKGGPFTDSSPTEPGDRILRRGQAAERPDADISLRREDKSRSIRNSILRKDIMWTYKAR